MEIRWEHVMVTWQTRKLNFTKIEKLNVRSAPRLMRTRSDRPFQLVTTMMLNVLAED